MGRRRFAAVLAALPLMAVMFSVGQPTANAAGWAGPGTYQVTSGVADIHVRERQDALSLSQIGPGTEIQVISAPSNGWVYARVRGSGSYAVNICAWVRWENSWFSKTSSDTGAFNGTCPNALVYAPDGSGPRVHPSRYAQWRQSAVDADPQTNDHGWDGYWYTSPSGGDGLSVQHAAYCPIARTRDHVNNTYGFHYPWWTGPADDLRLRYVTSDGQAAYVHVVNRGWGFVPIACITQPL